MPRAAELIVNVIDRQRGKLATAPLAGFVERCAREVPPLREGELSLCLVGDGAMRSANRRFREVDATTDVLSFPTDALEQDGRRYLGDVMISVPQARRQASDRGHSLARELKLLALHGYLHLLGYDHEQDRGLMLRLERRLARRLLA